MPNRLADRLLAAGHSLFVGREEECRLFQEVLTSGTLPYLVCYVTGPGGVGKTALLREFRYRCIREQVPAYVLDGRTVDSTPEAFLGGLRHAMQLTKHEDPWEALGKATERQVLMVDTFEVLAPLERWLINTFFPRLTDDTLVVLAGREAPSSVWHASPGWQALMRTLSLRNLSPHDGKAYLSASGIPADQHDTVLNFTHGHPLALSLISDVFSQRPGMVFKPEAAPNVVKALLDRFVMKVPSPAHRTALEACALVRFTTEPLLAALVAMRDGHELFEWLRSLSFIDSGPYGLFPHDVAREALSTDLQWRNPEWHRTLHHRARLFYSTRLQEVQGREQRRILSDYIFLHRDNPVVRPFFNQLQSQWENQAGSVSEDRLRPSDIPILADLVTRHEGPRSAAYAKFWFERQPEGVLVYRDDTDQPVGLLVMLALAKAASEDRQADPATRAAWNYLTHHAPLREGEEATLFRFWLAKDTYQAVSPIQSLIFVSTVRHYLTRPGLAYTFLPCAKPDFWSMVFAFAKLKRLQEADFEVDGQTFGVYGHDWRVMPPPVWLEALAEQGLKWSSNPAEPPHTRPVIVLSEEEFAEALKNALRAYARPHTLKENPLLHSRIVLERTGRRADEADLITELRALLKEAADQLQNSPRLTKFYRALDRTYFRPAASQEQAAELLDLPYSTFRRHLSAGVSELTSMLWYREIA